MSEKALRDLNTILGTERKNEDSSKACLSKPSVDNAVENIEEWQKKNNSPSLVSPAVNGNLAVTANSGAEVVNPEVEYIESENLNDVDDADTCLKVFSYPLFGLRDLQGLKVDNH